MRRLFGGILLAVGILIAGASGLCSLIFLINMIPSGGDAMSMLGMVMVVGGIGRFATAISN